MLLCCLFSAPDLAAAPAVDASQALSADHAGVYTTQAAGSAAGAAYVYNLDGTGEVKITASDAAASDQFGTKIAIGNNKIVVGAQFDDDDGSSSGSVYVYDLDGTNEVKINASDAASGDQFGDVVAVGSNRIVVGAYRDDDDGTSSGSA